MADSAMQLLQVIGNQPVCAPRAVAGSAAALEVLLLEINRIRQDGQTQSRVATDPVLAGEFALLMAEGVEFPPVRVWFDGRDYWLSDGFHRVEAALRAGRTRIAAEVRHGTLSDAQWDSYGVNGTHGARRTTRDVEAIVARALRHPHAEMLSNVQIARHLHIPEPTLRRWRNKLMSRNGDAVRVVRRGQFTYRLKTQNIGKRKPDAARAKTIRDLHIQLGEMKANASPNTRRVLNVIGNWAFGGATALACLDAIEDAIGEWTREGKDRPCAGPTYRPRSAAQIKAG